MSVFRWTAPLFKLASRRWSDEDFRELADVLSPTVPAGGLFADLGGGTGDLGAGIARALDAQVIIIDPTPQMLRRVGAEPLVSVRLAAAESLPFPAGHFDAVLCCDAFHHFRDQDAAAREIARAVRPGGGVVIIDIEMTARGVGMVAAVERLLGEPAGFRTAEGMQSFLAGHGINGTTRREKGETYLFAGIVRR